MEGRLNYNLHNAVDLTPLLPDSQPEWVRQEGAGKV